jgi:uncharacterized membrane protein YhaH (DUF805 family)
VTAGAAVIPSAGRSLRLVLATAAIWGAGLLVAAVVAPVYSSVSASSDGRVAHSSSTLTEENGPGVLAPVGVPLVVVGVVAVALRRRRQRQRPGAGVLAWMSVGLLGVFTLVSMLSIGIFVLPVTFLLVVACALA